MIVRQERVISLPRSRASYNCDCEWAHGGVSIKQSARSIPYCHDMTMSETSKIGEESCEM